jgi:hypothetical protein
MNTKEKLIPGGILEPVSGRVFLFFGASYKTSDFMMDGMLLWWEQRKHDLLNITDLVINLDNGAECSGRTTQFLQRMVDFSILTGLNIRLVYYPPYHSKYNAIERYWAGLEKSWNGYLLDSTDTVLKRASHFAWKGSKAVVSFLGQVYEKGVKVVGEEKQKLEQCLERLETLQWWDIKISPKKVF